MDTQEQLSASFPFESKYVEVHGAKMHYVEQGSGDPILFLHGIPTSSYLWRNMITPISSVGRCIAVDLIGFGQSDKPKIEYRITDHIKFIESFIEALNLKNITLMMHAWGSVIGFDYAIRHQDNVQGLAFYEAHVCPMNDPDMFSLPAQQWLASLKENENTRDAVMKDNIFVNKILPSEILRQLSKEEMDHYLAPFKEPDSCYPIWQYYQELPFNHSSEKVDEIISNYSEQLQHSKLPKLMFYAVPGFITTIAAVQWAKEHFPELTLVDIGDALHYAQEFKPKKLSEEFIKWYKTEII